MGQGVATTQIGLAEKGKEQRMPLSRRAAGFLLGAAVWTWWLWVTRLVNLAQDERSHTDGDLNGFFWVHAALAAGSLAIGVGLAALGWRGLRRPHP